MTDEPRHDEASSPGDEVFEEALDAAEVFSDLANDEKALGLEEGVGARTDGAEGEAVGAQADAFADEFELPALRATAAAVESRPAPAADAGEPAEMAELGTATRSIGELFKPVVKHSPPSKIRIESDSIGALFRRFIDQG